MIKRDNTLRGLSFFVQDYNVLIEKINEAIDKKKSCFIATPTTEIIGVSFKDNDYLNILAKADILLPDSVTLVQIGILLGKKIIHRLTGVDIVFKLGKSENRRYKVFFIGAKEEVLHKAVKISAELLPAFEIVGSHNGYFFKTEEDKVIEDINNSGAEVLLVGLGFPKQEHFIFDNLDKLTVPVKITVGGSFDVISGTLKRAPDWMQNLGLEWLYRLIQEPSRWHRMILIPWYLLQLFFYEITH